MDPRSSPEKEGPSSPVREVGPGHSDTPSSVISNTMPRDNQGNHQNIVGDYNTPVMNIGGQVIMNIHNSPGEKSKTTSEKKLSAVVRDYKQFLSETENTTLRTKLDQLQVGSNKHFVERKFSKDGSEGITSSELLRKISKSKTSLVSGPSGSGKSTIAANIIMNWAKSEEDNSFDILFYLSSLNITKSLTLHKLVWGEFASRIGKDSMEILEELVSRKGKILVIIDGLGIKDHHNISCRAID